MKVAHIITGLGNGGAEGALYRLTTADPRHVHEVISLMDMGVYGPRLERAGIPVHALGLTRGRLSVRRLVTLYRLLRRIEPDVIQTWMYHADLVGGITARLAGYRALVWGVRASDAHVHSGALSTLLVWVCARLSGCVPARIVFASAAGRDIHCRMGYSPRKGRVVENGYDTDRFAPDADARRRQRRAWRLADGVRVFGSVARWDPLKDHETLAGALARLLQLAGSGWTCVLVGPGMDDGNAELRVLLERIGVADRVRLMGSVDDIPSVMNALDAHVLSSKSEGFPNVLAEAMACGVPCVSTDVGDARRIVGETGWLVPSSDAGALAGALRDALDTMADTAAWEARRAACRARVLAEYSLSRMVDRYDRVWAEAVTRLDQHVSANVDRDVVESFAREWERFDQRALSDGERAALFDAYFAIFPWQALPRGAVGFDAGCGTGRWALLVAPRVGHLHCVDPSRAIAVAARNLAALPNVSFHQATVDDMPLADASMDFGYSLGVLHHLPDPARGLAACARKLKPGAPFLVYLYYAFENQPLWYRAIWRASEAMRRVVSRSPHALKLACSQAIAATVYWPLARTAAVLERLGAPVSSFPLSGYRDRSFYTMRTDALDRFGTSLVRRFTSAEIADMMEQSGLERIAFNTDMPYWCAIGYRR